LTDCRHWYDGARMTAPKASSPGLFSSPLQLRLVFRPAPPSLLQLGQTYYFHIYGVDPFLWESLPDALRGGRGEPRPPGLQGGLEIDFLGHRLRRGDALAWPAAGGGHSEGALQTPHGGAPRGGAAAVKVAPSAQKTPHPRPAPFTPRGAGGSGGGGAPSELGDCALRQLLQRAAELQVKPFWLAARWTPRGMQPEQDQPPPEEMRGAGRGPLGMHDPAGMLERAHRDFLLCVLFYPYKDM
jgi:hypothetical protein